MKLREIKNYNSYNQISGTVYQILYSSIISHLLYENNVTAIRKSLYYDVMLIYDTVSNLIASAMYDNTSIHSKDS